MCICSLRYPACNAHVPYCHLWPVQHYNICPHFLINGTIFKKQLLNIEYMFQFSLQLFFQNISHSKKNWRRYIKNVYWTSCKVPHYSSQILMTREFYGQVFWKILKYQISEQSIQWEPSCYRTNRHEEDNGHFLQFCKHA